MSGLEEKKTRKWFSNQNFLLQPRLLLLTLREIDWDQWLPKMSFSLSPFFSMRCCGIFSPCVVLNLDLVLKHFLTLLFVFFRVLPLSVLLLGFNLEREKREKRIISQNIFWELHFFPWIDDPPINLLVFSCSGGYSNRTYVCIYLLWHASVLKCCSDAF